MKKIALLTSLIALGMVLSPSVLPQATVKASEEVKLTLSGQPLTFSLQPRMLNGTLFVPLRELTTALGADVSWNEDSGSVTVSKSGTSLTFTVGSHVAVRGDAQIQMSAAPVMEQGQMLVPLRLISESFDFNVYWDGANLTADIMNAAESLPTVGSADKLKELLQEASADSPAYVGDGIAVRAMKVPISVGIKEKAKSSADSAPESPAAPTASVAANAEFSGTLKVIDQNGAPDYSKTNVQVQVVDEADVIKTDGKYIYQVNRGRIVIAEAYPADNMNVVSTLQFENRQLSPIEMYVDDKYLIVIGNASKNVAYPAEEARSVDSPVGAKIKIAVVPENPQVTKAVIYDISDKTNLHKVREFELEGGYVTSRKVGSSLYLVANKYINRYRILQQQGAAGEQAQAVETPSYRDSLAGDSYIKIGLEDVRYFPKSIEPNYLLVAGLNLDQPDQKLAVQSYLGAGQNVYASPNNLYVTMQKYEPVTEPADADGSGAEPAAERPAMPIVAMNTTSTIYKFALDQGKIRYSAKGTVPGRVLNQYSMDEQNGYFRIATTTGEEWRQDEHTSKNNLYVLNEKLELSGKIEDIAPGERIYSVRFMGNRAYMVTYRTVDPFFVIDLADVKTPKILGQLKIPGYSNYLHPYDENHIIGFGKDTEEVSNYGGSAANGAPSTTAYYQGMKLAVFDVTNVGEPVEMFKEIIGDRGTDSPLLNNPKALLFSKEKGLLAFPVTVMEIKNKSASPTAKEVAQYGQFAFQGAYVYHLDLKDGFKLRGKITHLTEDELAKAGNRYGGDRSIQRILYIGDNLYTSSQSMLKANRLDTLEEIKSIEIK
ncbi:beta-propeller domain-containing protein [Paenibacillus hamazuiensis]|uniref:beta-propeller domain-containing protein n=1 Tax=Paenibacillus hamazuiensis TaxID=2936508 RepID=UPI00200E5616|nr:beta-propeller domain-containing protein [Paenibacillus hamazuiensis]